MTKKRLHTVLLVTGICLLAVGIAAGNRPNTDAELPRTDGKLIAEWQGDEYGTVVNPTG